MKKLITILLCCGMIFVVSDNLNKTNKAFAKATYTKKSGYIFQSPSNFKVYSPQWTLASYISAWKNSNWAGMLKYTQPFWKRKYGNPAQQIKDLNDFVKTWKSFQINSVGTVQHDSYVGITYVDVYFTLIYESWADSLVKTKIKARLVKENGRWGVNPDSTLEENRIWEKKI